jgi:hypothetical protein
MHIGPTTHRLLKRSLALVVLLAFLAPETGLGAVLPQKAQGPLAPALATLAKPSVASKSPARQARIIGFAPTGPGSLLRQGGRVLVRVRFDHGAIASRDAVRAAGGRVLDASRRYQSATVAVAPADLRALAGVSDVASVTPIRTPLLFAPNCEGGSVISEGVAKLHADEARTIFGVDGTGVPVGVLSDSYDQATEAATGGPIETHAEEDVETADLPGLANPCAGQTTPVNVLKDFESEEATDEGRGMLQIVHDMAPKAPLSFATAFEGEEGFAKSIENLATAGAKVIVDDVGYFEEPMFQDGPIANAITKVTSTKGVSYLSAAGNDNLFDEEGNEIASWEAPEYRETGSCPPALVEFEKLIEEELHASHCMDFNPGPETDRAYGIKVEPGAALLLDLQWAEPWEGVESDLDAYLLNANGTELIGGSAEANELTQRPLEIAFWPNETSSTQTVQLVINRYSGPGARLKFVLLQNGGGVSGVEYPRSGGGDVVGPSIFGHAGAASAIAVGAMRYAPRPGEGEEPEFYSSRGPVTHYFEPFKGPVAANPLPTPEALSKPDVTATDCGGTTFFADLSEGEWHFCGTSAAAPHAAGAVALMRNAAPLASNELLRESLVGTASPIGAFGPCAIGGGLVETVAAVKAAREELAPVAPEACEPPDASGAVFVAPGNWGSEAPPPPNPNPTPTPTPVVKPPPPPNTSILKHPHKVVGTRGRTVRVAFRFGSDQAGVTFRCKVDKGSFRGCGARFVHRFGLGAHVVRVAAVSSAGLADPTPAVFRFRVRHVG